MTQFTRLKDICRKEKEIRRKKLLLAMIEAWYLVSLPVDIDFFLRRESRTIADGSAPVDFPNFFQSQQNCNVFAWNFYFLNESDLKTLHLRKQHQYTKTAAIFQQKLKYHPSSLRNNNNSEPNFFSFAGQQQCCDVQSIIIFSWCFRSDKWRILPLFAKKFVVWQKKMLAISGIVASDFCSVLLLTSVFPVDLTKGMVS